MTPPTNGTPNQPVAANTIVTLVIEATGQINWKAQGQLSEFIVHGLFETAKAQIVEKIRKSAKDGGGLAIPHGPIVFDG